MSKIVTMMHRRPPPNATPFLLLVIAAVAVVITPTPAKSFAFQSSSSPVRLPFRLVATSTRPWSSSAASASSPSSQKHHPSGRVALAMSSGAAATDSMDASNNTGGTASIPNEVFNLVKSIVGAGVLSLPAGIAAFGNAPSAVIPATALITLIGLISAYGFSLIGRVCSYTGGQSYRDAWTKSVGDSTSWIPAVTCTFKTCCAILSYSMILADTTKALLMTATGWNVSRTASLLGITTTALLPLCLLKNLSSLAPFSLVGISGMFYTAIAMAVRYFGGAYRLGSQAVKGSRTAPAGKYLSDVASNYRPSFGNLGATAALSPNVFILVCLLSTAYMAHFNAPKFYTELKDNTIQRYNTVVGTSFGISILLFGLVGTLGFLTFGASSSGLILNNYSGRDVLMSLSRIAVAVSIVFSYPLAFAGARDGWLDLLKVPMNKRTDGVLTKTTLAILACVTFAATQLKELAFLMSLAGATLGNALIYVYPALMFRSAVKGMGSKASGGLKREVPLAMFAAALGVVFGGIGAKMAFGLL